MNTKNMCNLRIRDQAAILCGRDQLSVDTQELLRASILAPHRCHVPPPLRLCGPRLELHCNRLEIADCSLDGLSADTFSLAEVPEHGQGQGKLVVEQVAELLNMVEILR